MITNNDLNKYMVTHWLLVLSAIMSSVYSLIALFERSRDSSWGFAGQSLFLVIIILIMSHEVMIRRSTTKGRKILYILLVASALAPIMTGLTGASDLVVVLGAMMLIVSFLFPVVIFIGGFFVTEQPAITEGRLTPLILSVFSFVYNFCQFSIIS